MKKTILFFILLSFAQASAKAQNLVPNPSFEEFDSCCDAQSEINYSKYWTSFGATPDYYNACSSSIYCSIPDNFAGYHYAASGNAYAGLIFYYQTNYREFLGVPLIQPLLPGHLYHVSYKVSLAFTDSIGFNVGCNNFGVLFTNHQYSISSPPVLSNNCSLNFNGVITDTTNWITLSGDFISDSTYHYLVIGNFYDNAHTDTSRIGHGVPNGYHSSYYYLDDVDVSIPEGVPLFEDSMIYTYPNPVSDILTISKPDRGKYTCLVTNLPGQVVYSDKTEINGSYSFNCRALKEGIYFISLFGEHKVYKSKFVVKH